MVAALMSAFIVDGLRDLVGFAREHFTGHIAAWCAFWVVLIVAPSLLLVDLAREAYRAHPGNLEDVVFEIVFKALALVLVGGGMIVAVNMN